MHFAQIPDLETARARRPQDGTPRSGVDFEKARAVVRDDVKREQGWRAANIPPPLYHPPDYDQGVPPTRAAKAPSARQSNATRIFMEAILSPLDDVDTRGPVSGA
jgi:hypothetical protein